MAAATRDQTSIEGALYELVARGVKDTYFIKDDKEAAHPFQWTYDRWPASLPETRFTHPNNAPRWGGRCEFEFDLPADVLVEATLLVQLPTWLPPEMSPYNLKSVTYETQYGTGRRYGYVKGAAYFLFDRIQLFQDNLLLQEISGDSLYFASLNKGSWNQGYLTQQLAGDHDGTVLAVQRNATPPTLELPLPVPGCMTPGDRGLPLVGLRQQSFRLRLHLRKLEDMVECTQSTSSAPAPWNVSTFTQITQTGSVVAPPLAFDDIGPPILTLRTKQLYLLNEAREALAAEKIEVPYIRYFDNLFSANQLDYVPLDKGGTANLVKFLDATYTVERIFSYFRSTRDLEQNRLYIISNAANVDGNYYTTMQLTIAGQLREGPWTAPTWEFIVPHAKEERYGVTHLPLMNWTRGWRIEDMPAAVREPTGGINFSTADRPMLTVGLTNIEAASTLRYKQSYLTSCCESWGLYVVEKGRGRLEYYN